MVWLYRSEVKLNRSDVTIEQLWKVWSNISLMGQYDPDVLKARLATIGELRSRLETTVAAANNFADTASVGGVGVPIYITLKSNPSKENTCVITKWQPPCRGQDTTDDISTSDSVALHYDLHVPLGVLSFQYGASLDTIQNTVTVTVGTEISGLFGPMYAGLFKGMIIHGCDHMIVSVPELAKSIQ